MQTIAFPTAHRRRSLAWGGALFLAFDALLMAGALLVITQGEQTGLAIGFGIVGLAVSALLAHVLARPPLAKFDHAVLHVHAAHRTLAIPADALRLAEASVVDLAQWPSAQLPGALARTNWWRTGDALGWQRSDDGQRYFCAVTRPGPAVMLPFGEDDVLLLASDEPAALLEALRAAQPARASSASTAGRVLPSMNSRNAPPPVEM